MSMLLKAFLGPENVARTRDWSLDPEKKHGWLICFRGGKRNAGRLETLER